MVIPMKTKQKYMDIFPLFLVPIIKRLYYYYFYPIVTVFYLDHEKVLRYKLKIDGGII